MLVTLEVLKLGKERLARLVHPENIYAMDVTLEVMKLLKLRSRLFRLEHFSNIFAIVVTFDVLRYVRPENEVRLVIPENHLKHEAGLALAKLLLNVTLFTDVAFEFHPGTLLPVLRLYTVPVLEAE